MNRLKPHLALLVCNVLWAMDYPFYNIVLPHYVHPMAMVSASLVATALFSLVPLLWQKAEKVERADIRKLIGAALLIGVPVGFVNVVESKELIIEGGRAPYIVARGRKGGSNVAAAICNALLYQIRR